RRSEVALKDLREPEDAERLRKAPVVRRFAGTLDALFQERSGCGGIPVSFQHTQQVETASGTSMVLALPEELEALLTGGLRFGEVTEHDGEEAATPQRPCPERRSGLAPGQQRFEPLPTLDKATADEPEQCD